MNEAQIAIVSLLVGGALSGATTWYFFRKSVSKRLSVHIQFASPVLSGVDDPEVRKALEIRYRGTEIEDLFQLQFVVANEGQRAIRDLLDPLSLTLPKAAKLLEARVLHVEPKGREVSIGPVELADGRTKVEFRFKLLNRREFFFVKMLVNGKLDVGALRFSIAVDDLPPIIVPERQVFTAPDGEPTTGVGALLLGLLPLAVGLATAFGIVELRRARPDLFPGGPGFAWLSWTTMGLLLWVAGMTYWFGRATQLVVARGLLGRKHRFKLPPAVETIHGPHFYFGEGPEDELYFLLERRLRHLSPHQRRRLMHELQTGRMPSGRGDD